MGILASAAAGFGVVFNLARPAPLPWRYEAPGERLIREKPQVIGTATAVDVLRASRNGEAVILDARPRAFFDFGHVPGAVPLSKDEFEKDFASFQRDARFAARAAVIVYCSGGDCEDSAFVARKLAEAGLSELRIFEGGWEEWETLAHPVER